MSSGEVYSAYTDGERVDKNNTEESQRERGREDRRTDGGRERRTGLDGGTRVMAAW